MVSGFQESFFERLQRIVGSSMIADFYHSEDRYVSLNRLTSGNAGYLSTLSRNTREQIRRSSRLFEERYGAPVVERADTREQGAAWFQDLQVLHAQRWQERNQAGAFANGPVRAFHSMLIGECVSARLAANELAVDLLRVRFGSNVIAVLYNLRYQRTVSFYQAGFGYESDNRLRPGLVAHALAIQYYIEQGDHEYDFLAGGREGARYKRSLAAETRQLIWGEFIARRSGMRLVAGAKALRRLVLRVVSRHLPKR